MAGVIGRAGKGERRRKLHDARPAVNPVPAVVARVARQEELLQFALERVVAFA